MASFLLAALAVFFSVSTSIALQCYSWGDESEPINTTCDNACAVVKMEGWDTITRQELSLTVGMCDDGGCNTTCSTALHLKLVRNIDLKECNATCCTRDLCNTISASPNPTERRLQTRAKPRITKEVYTHDRGVWHTGLKCFKCTAGMDFHDCNNMYNTEHCGPEHDACFSITGKLTSDSPKVITHRGCALQAFSCDVMKLCNDTDNKMLVKDGVRLETCDGYCCSGSFCNVYIPTKPVLDKTNSIVTTRARRTIKKIPSPSSLKCYECKPDTFDSLCNRNDTEKSCVTGSYGYDGCFTMTAVISNATNGELVSDGEWKGCAVRDEDCNANSSRCDTLFGILESRGLHLKECLVDCCHGDLCNNFLPTPGPNLTMYVRSQAHARCTTCCHGYSLMVLSMITLGLYC